MTITVANLNSTRAGIRCDRAINVLHSELFSLEVQYLVESDRNV